MSRPRSVSDIAAMFENKSNNTKSQMKPPEKVKARKHSKSAFFENIFKTQQLELTQGPRKELSEGFDAINDETKHIESLKFNPGKVSWNPTIKRTISTQRSVGKLNLDAHFTDDSLAADTPQKPPGDASKIAVDNNFAEKLNSCLKGESKKGSEEVEEEEKDETIRKKEQMMTCAPDQVEPPEMPQAPKPKARAFFSEYIIAESNQVYPYVISDIRPWSDYVGEGSYPDNRTAFPNSAAGTFDGIAVDANTRVIMWEQPNFQGKVLLDVTGPIIINNNPYQSSWSELAKEDFKDPELQKNYPPNVRVWSETNMNSWTHGSVKIVAL